MNHPQSAFGAAPPEGDPGGRAEPVRGVCLMRSTRAYSMVRSLTDH